MSKIIRFFFFRKLEIIIFKFIREGKCEEVSSRIRVRRVLCYFKAFVFIYRYLERENDSVWDKSLIIGDFMLGEVYR